MARPIVTLTTDFGLRDPSVGSVKGVILSIHPDAVLVDLTHDLPRHAIASAAYVLRMAARYFPAGSIHLVVVDPGVGSARRPLVCSAGGRWYIGPDNGVFAEVCHGDAAAECYAIVEARYCLKPPRSSPTFQGRDVFAPAAAWLARGTPPSAFGPRVTDPVGGEAEPASSRQGRVMWVDRFGNLISGIEPDAGVENFVVSVAGREIPFVTHYAEGPEDAPSALVNSDGLVEVFVNRGAAAALLGVSIGAPVALIPRR